MEKKIGVYICTGCDIDKALDVEAMAKCAKKEMKVPVARTHPHLCGSEGLELMRQDRDQEGVNCFVIAACSQRQHEQTF
ncbi:MAG: heterodisulfide reductase subunit A, partial [Deltaproteobacteria bacterium]|nr:heterodisulfide reductase subunit A [Deltaproteobacteria bacterium]